MMMVMTTIAIIISIVIILSIFVIMRMKPICLLRHVDIELGEHGTVRSWIRDIDDGNCDGDDHVSCRTSLIWSWVEYIPSIVRDISFKSQQKVRYRSEWQGQPMQKSHLLQIKSISMVGSVSLVKLNWQKNNNAKANQKLSHICKSVFASVSTHSVSFISVKEPVQASVV